MIYSSSVNRLATLLISLTFLAPLTLSTPTVVVIDPNNFLALFILVLVLICTAQVFLCSSTFHLVRIHFRVDLTLIAHS